VFALHSFIHFIHEHFRSSAKLFFFQYFYFSFELKPESSVWLNVDACRLSFDPSSEGVWYLFARFSVDLRLENDICVYGDALVTLYHAFSGACNANPHPNRNPMERAAPLGKLSVFPIFLGFHVGVQVFLSHSPWIVDCMLWVANTACRWSG